MRETMVQKAGYFRYAVTDTSVSLFWERKEPDRGNCRYQINRNGKTVGITDKTHFTAEGLKEASEYQFDLYLLTEKDDPMYLDGCSIRTEQSKRRLDITRAPYHAVGDGITINTQAIQRALDDCTEEDMVYIPSGVFMTGALRMHSNTELYLEEGAVLQGTDCPEDYLPLVPSRFEGTERKCYSGLLNLGNLDRNGGPNCENIRIRGKGTIASGGQALAVAVIALETERMKEEIAQLGDCIEEYEKPETIPGRVRPRLIHMCNCRNVRLSGLKLADGASWNVHMIYSEQILTDRCTFHSEKVWNGDGWDPDSSEDCTIFACAFYTGDDAIAVKSGKNPEGNLIGRPCRRIRIFDCICSQGHGIAIGSEISGGVEDVKIWDCNLQGSLWGLEIKGTKKRGGYVRNVQVSRCMAPGILIHSVTYNDDGAAAKTPPVFEKYGFTDMELSGYAPTGKEKQDAPVIELNGFDVPGYEIRDVQLRRIRMPEDREQTIRMQYCKNITLEELSVGKNIGK